MSVIHQKGNQLPYQINDYMKTVSQGQFRGSLQTVLDIWNQTTLDYRHE